MSLTVCQAPPHHWAFLYGRLGLHISTGFCAMEVVDDLGRIHAMVGFDNWTRNGVDMHVVVDTPWGLRRIRRPAFRFAFREKGLAVAHAHVRADNGKSLVFVGRLGFREVYRAKDWHADGVDDVLFELRREECRFLGDTHA